MSGDVKSTIEYATRGYQSSRRWNLPRSLSLASLAPLVFLPTMLFTSGYWSRWFNTGQSWERDCGIAWLITLAISFLCILVFIFSLKRWDIWLAFGLHVAFILVSVLPPGCIFLAWLMHWMHGPGA